MKLIILKLYKIKTITENYKFIFRNKSLIITINMIP